MRHPSSRSLAALCGLTLIVAAAAQAQAQAPAAPQPVATIAMAGYDELMKDMSFIGSLAGQPQAGQMLEMMLNSATQQKGLVGLDKSKPLGVILQSGGPMGMTGGACIPVTDLNALLEVAKPFGVTSEDAGNGVTKIQTPGQMVFAKKSGNWALLGMSPDMLAGLPADPGAELSALTKEYDLAFTIHVQNVPEAFRQTAVEALSQGARQGMIKSAGESDADFAERQKTVDAQLEQLKRSINELDQVTVGLAVDSTEKRAFLDFSYTAVAGSQLAQEIAANSDSKTNFAGFIQPNAALVLSFAEKVTGADAAQLDQMVETLRKQAGKAIDDESKLKSDKSKDAMKEAFNDFIDAMQATLKAGVMDGGAVLNVSPEALTFVAGGYIGDPAKFESGLKKIAEVGKEEAEGDMPEVEWAAETHGDVTFHKLSVPTPDDEHAKQLFGDTIDMAVGIGKQSVYFGLGRDSLAAVEKVIDDSAKSPNKAVAPMEMTISLSQIMNMAQSVAEDDKKPQIEAIATMLQNEAKDHDHVRMVAQPIPNGIRLRIEAEEGVLRAIGMGAMQAQMEAAGAR